MSSAWYIVPFVMSVFAFGCAVGLVVYWFTKPKRLKKKKVFAVTRNTGRHLMYFSLILLFSVWFLRFAVGNWCFVYPDPTGEIPKMGWDRQIFNSFLHALQTFSLDEDYTAYLENGRAMVLDIFNGHCSYILALYLSVLNVIAPIAGGAFVFEILAGIFPQLRYTLSRFNWYKNRFYFTALNEQSLALAKSILSDPSYKHVLLIFTDVYYDDENEESSEMLLSAKALGAVCLKDDLLHIPLKRFGKCRTYIFLSDQDETENLQTLSQLLNPEKQKELFNTEISVFGTDNKTSNIEDEVIYLHNRLSAEYEDRNMKIIPDIAPVNGVRNMSQNLFYKLPLFEGLYGKSKENQKINLTIIGSGVIGTEMFLNAYWFGQMAGVELNINIVSENETEQEFIDRIDGINPDIMATSRNGDEKLDALIGEDRRNPNRIPQPRYFHFRYKKKNITSCNLEAFLKTGIGDDGFHLINTDYFIVAVGSDEDNFLIADRLRQTIGYYHLNEAPKNKTIISYVIYNSDLCNKLNAKSRQNHIYNSDEHEFDIYMYAFGSIEEIFCVENILRKEISSLAKGIGETYEIQQKDKESIASKQLKTRQYYNKRADDVRRLQMRYKIFCAGLLSPTLFSTKDNEEYENLMRKAEDDFADNVTNVWTYPEFSAKANALAWMEHRRWNAFMRINGFRTPDNIDKYMELDSDVHCLKPNHDKKYQFLFIKKHPCIVECDMNGYPGIYSKESDKKPKNHQDFGPDELDLLCKKLDTDYKLYDYPESDAARC